MTMACFDCRPDTSGAVPGAFVILLAQDAESAWSFTVRQVPLWLGRIVQVSGTCCKLHFFTRCRCGMFPVLFCTAACSQCPEQGPWK